MKNINEGNEFKPTNKKPVSQLSKTYEKNFNKTMKAMAPNVQLNEIDGLLTEKEQSLKKKIFSLPKMEALVFSDPILTAKYDEMSENGEEKYGYHYNETIMNMIFNDYVLNSSKYLQKYKMAIPKEKKRRDKSGINQLKKAGEEKMEGSGLSKSEKVNEQSDEQQFEPQEDDCFVQSDGFKLSVSCGGKYIGEFVEDQDAYNAVKQWKQKNNFFPNTWFVSDHGNISLVDDDGNTLMETTGSGSSGAFAGPMGFQKKMVETTTSASSGAYVGPAVWGGGDLMKTKGKANVKTKPMVDGGTIIQESEYLIDPSGFVQYIGRLDEQSDINYIQKHSEAFGSLNNMNSDNKKIIKKDIQTGQLDTPNLNEKAKSKAQQRFMGMVHAVQKGELSPEKVGDSVTKAAASMSDKDAEDFASTKHKGLPEKIDEVLSLHDVVEYISDRNGEEPFDLHGAKWQFVNAKYPDGKMDIGVYRFGHDLVYNYDRWREEMGIDNNNIKEDTQTMIQNNGTSMSNKATPTGDQSSNMDMGARTSGGMNESYETLLEEINNELNAFSIHHNKLIKMAEDRKPSALVLRDRVGSENEKNFKSDLNDSSVSKLIDIENALEFADQQTVVKDPQKLGQDIEKKSIKASDMKSGEALKNVGDSANHNGDEIPKRNLTKDEQDEVNMYRLGLGDVVFDNEPGKRFEERMKADMGDKLYKERQEKLEFRGKAPMYNKDTQPTEKGVENTQFNKEKSGWNDRIGLKEGFISGKYIDVIGKKKFIDFNVNDVVELNEADNTLSEINLEGMGNSYTQKVNVNEGVVKAISQYKFFTDGKNVFVVKNVTQKLNESESKNTKHLNEQMNKMKHLLDYNPNNFVNTDKIKINRGF